LDIVQWKLCELFEKLNYSNMINSGGDTAEHQRSNWRRQLET